MRRAAWPFVVAATLLVLLVALGTLQYRWLGEVSNAERDRLRASLRTRATQLSEDFDREITRTYSAFHVASDTFERDPAGTLNDAYERAQSGSSVGGLVKGVYLVDAREQAGGLQHLDPSNRRLQHVAWPDAFARWRRAAERVPPIASGVLSPLFMAESIDADVPALVVPIPTVKRMEPGARVAALPDPGGPARALIVWLDADRVGRQLLGALVHRHFGSADASEYLVSVVSRAHPSDLIYATGNRDDVTPENADLTTGLFALRLDEMSLFSLHVPPPAPDVLKEKSRLAITIVRRANAAGSPHVLMAGTDPQDAWQVLIRFKSGSLETLVARSRRRNMAIGLGVLGLLAASLAFVIGSAQRQRRLARQQMEFVAAVSHELRTPLAVIRSAGENLADGVVAGPDQVRRYGSLIQTEGRRLSEMVERVMEFAGITSGAVRPRSGVDVCPVIDDAVASVRCEARERGITINVRTAPGLPTVNGDASALRSVVQNLLGNAVKYSPDGSAVDLEAVCDDDGVRIVVADRGFGIDNADLPHIFKPFFRGRRAVDAQIRGTGVGLSVVRHVVDAHGGDIRVESRTDRGTIITVVLPATPHIRGVVAEARTAT